MVKYFINLFIMVMFNQWAYCADNLLLPQLTFVEKDNTERIADWKVHYFPVWRGQEGERELFLQVWIALPILLEISEDKNSKVKILENTTINKSPFASNNDVKKVLMFETQNPSSMFAFDKKNSTDINKEAKVKIKIQFSDNFTITKTSDVCKKLGVSL
jgi:hypothetical protein